MTHEIHDSTVSIDAEDIFRAIHRHHKDDANEYGIRVNKGVEGTLIQKLQGGFNHLAIPCEELDRKLNHAYFPPHEVEDEDITYEEAVEEVKDVVTVTVRGKEFVATATKGDIKHSYAEGVRIAIE